jgi:hypothetical protein
MKQLSLLLLLAIATSCDQSEDPVPRSSASPQPNQDWLIPVDEVFDVLGRDGIPSLSDPTLVHNSETEIFDPELVLGYFDGKNAIAYPHRILDWHEIINQRVDNDFITVTYCPLTGTGMGWPQDFQNNETEFGVSGLLYNSNLIAFDRNTNSNWSQMRLQAVSGPLKGTEMPVIQLVETRWSVWKSMFPETLVVSSNTGWDRPYGLYPYQDYRTNHNNMLFPISIDDGRLNRKERVHGVLVNGEAKVYRFGSFDGDYSLIQDTFEGLDIIVLGNNSDLIVSFEATLEDGSKPVFSPINDEGRAVIADSQGNQWDAFGYHVAGPTPIELKPTQSFMGFWFAWGTFYPSPEIYGI